MLTKLHGEMLQEIERLNAEVLEQCRINGMSAEREDALKAELTRLKASIALDKKAENARELGLDYEPAPVPLTDEQILEIKTQFVWTLDFQFTEFARAIEAAHGITAAPKKGSTT
jgi:hypothetical protein